MKSEPYLCKSYYGDDNQLHDCTCGTCAFVGFKTQMTDEEFHASNIKDVINWADEISSEWNGDELGSQEDRAHQANDILEKCNELKELIEGMAEL